MLVSQILERCLFGESTKMFAAEKIFSLGEAGTESGRRVPGEKSTAGINLGDLERRIGQGLEVSPPDLAAAGALLRGRFSLAELRGGFYLHCTQIQHLHDMYSRFPLQEAGIKILLRLEGDSRIRIGGREIVLDAGQGEDARPQAAILMLHQPELFERNCRAGSRERMLVITLAPGWLAASGLAGSLSYAAHLSLHPWQASARALSIAEWLICRDSDRQDGHTLLQESRALELIAEALGSLRTEAAPTARTDQTLSPAEYRRVGRLRDFLDAGHADAMSLAELAQVMACNANTLQRQFRGLTGRSIFSYLRASRLQRAAEAIEREGANVAQAAEIAGYNSQANFSTAFRKHFGFAPKQLKPRSQT